MNKKSQKTQLKIEQAMFELLKEKPYAELTVAEIAQRAMVSRMAFYRNFGGKDAILTHFLQQEFAAFIQARNITEFFIAGADATACVKSTCYNMAKAVESPLVILYQFNITKIYYKESNLATFLIINVEIHTA